MPTNRRRINISLPEDLEKLLMAEAESMRLPAATRVTQIINEHFARRSCPQLPPAFGGISGANRREPHVNGDK
jgi:hypothetical protein